MKRPLTTHFSALTLAFAIASLVPAQQPPPIVQQGGTGAPAGGPPQAAPGKDPSSTFSLKFEGGSVRDYVEQIRETFHDTVNIVTDEEANMAMLPPLSLKDVMVGTALKVMQGIARSDAKVSVNALSEGGSEVFIVRVTLQPKVKAPPPMQLPTQVLMPGQVPVPGGGAAIELPANTAPKRLEIISLARRLREDNPDISSERIDLHLRNLLTAIDAAMSLESDAGQASEHPLVKYHSETGLLMVRGTDPQIDAVQRILTEMVPNNLEGSTPEDPFQDPRVTAQLAELRSEISLLKEQLAATQLQLKLATEERTRPDDSGRKPKKPEGK